MTTLNRYSLALFLLLLLLGLPLTNPLGFTQQGQQQWLSDKVKLQQQRQYQLVQGDTRFAQVSQQLVLVAQQIQLHINERQNGKYSQQRFAFNASYPYQLLWAKQQSSSGVSASSHFFSDRSQHQLNTGVSQRHWRDTPVSLTLLDFLATAYWSTTQPSINSDITAGSWDFQHFTWQQHQVTYLGFDGKTHKFQRDDGINSHYYNGELQQAQWGKGLLLQSVNQQQSLSTTNKQQQFNQQQLVLNNSLPALPVHMTIRGPLAQWLEGSAHQQIVDKQNNLLQIQLQPYDNYLSTSDNANTSQPPSLTSFVSNEIAALVSGISGNNIEQLQQLQQKVHQRLRYSSDVAHTENLDSALNSGQGDCNHYQMLFSLAAQRLGFQSEQIRGLLYQSQPTPRFVLHTWNEVALNNQTIVIDASLNQFQHLSPRLRFNRQPQQQLLAQTAVGASSISTL